VNLQCGSQQNVFKWAPQLSIRPALCADYSCMALCATTAASMDFVLRFIAPGWQSPECSPEDNCDECRERGSVDDVGREHSGYGGVGTDIILRRVRPWSCPQWCKRVNRSPDMRIAKTVLSRCVSRYSTCSDRQPWPAFILYSNLLKVTAREMNWNKNKYIIVTKKNKKNMKYSANNFISIDCYFGNYYL